MRFPPVEEQVPPDKRFRPVQHHWQNLDAGLLSQRKSTGFEPMDFPSFDRVPSGKWQWRPRAKSTAFLCTTAAPSLQRPARGRCKCRRAKRDTARKGRLEYLPLRNPPEIERHVIERRNIDYRIVVQHDDILFFRSTYSSPTTFCRQRNGTKRKCAPESATIRALRDVPCRTANK